jgi:hypothetical protein
VQPVRLPPPSSYPLGGSALAITPPPSNVTQPPMSFPPYYFGYYGGLYAGYYGGSSFGGGFGYGSGFGQGGSWFIYGWPGPPPYWNNANIGVYEQSFLNIGKKPTGFADWQNHDRSSISLGINVICKESVVVSDFAFRASDIVRLLDSGRINTVPPGPRVPNSTLDRLAVWDKALLYASIPPVGFESIKIKSVSNIGLGQHQLLSDQSSVKDLSFVATGNPGCYGDWEVVDYSIIQLHTPVPPNTNPIAVRSQSYVLVSTGYLSPDWLNISDQSVFRSQPTITERPPLNIGTVDQARIAISVPLVVVESLAVYEPPMPIAPGTQNITGNVLRPVDQVILGFPQPWGRPSDTPSVTDSVSVTVG